MFAALARDIRARGWVSLIPLVPGEKRPAINGWQRFNSAAPSDDEINAWCTAHPRAGIGLAFGPDRLLGVDLDFLDADKAARAKAIMQEAFSSTPLLRVGLAPKLLAVYRLASGAIAPGKAFGGFELFTTSGQCVLFGTHPATGRPYHWPEASPATAPPRDAPEVSQAQIDDFLKQMHPLREDVVVIRQKRTSNVTQVGVWLQEFNSLPDQAAMIEVAARAIAATKVGARHPTMVAVVTALVIRAVPSGKFEDAIEEAYHTALDRGGWNGGTRSVSATIEWAERIFWGGKANVTVPRLRGPW